MTQEEIKELGEKMAKKEATPEEEQLFFQELNQRIGSIRADLAKLKIDKLTEEIKNKHEN